VLPKPGAEIEYDEEAQAYYSYDYITHELISFDTPEVVQKKVDYILKHGLGGSMFWEAAGDKKGNESLISTSFNFLETLDASENWLNFPDSRYVNIALGMPDQRAQV
jgi:chitinase